MKRIHSDKIKDYQDDITSFIDHKPAIQRQLIISIISVFLAFLSLFFIFYFHWAWVFVFTFFLMIFVTYQKLPPIKCPQCSKNYLYVEVIPGSDSTIYGICRTCKIKMNTEITPTSG